MKQVISIKRSPWMGEDKENGELIKNGKAKEEQRTNERSRGIN